ncbi:stalk domain-containing protein [Brevibacillus sp. NRS-1366]|uniref:stalk domain-containing protein n=1 Tax=Brevibacillus sp. NRS-1366 TaxID=3233899 RepID=UPI003D251431
MNRCLHTNSSLLWPRLLGAFFVCLSLCFGLFDKGGVALAEEPGPTVSLVINGKGVFSDVKPLRENGRMLVPIRTVAEATGAAVGYDAATRQVTLGEKGKHVSLIVNSRIAYVNGKRFTLDVPPKIVNKRTVVPIRFVSEALGYRLHWDGTAGVAQIESRPAEDLVASVKAASNPYVVQPGDTRSEIALLQSSYLFPFDNRSWYEPYGDSFGSDREWTESNSGSVRRHEGIDIMAPKGTPVYSVSAGTINRVGWNTYGGWRVNITDKNGQFRMYYAHLSAFVPGLRIGDSIKAGQLIGFVGDTGYGGTGTVGMFAPHLHFGLYRNDDGRAVDPYYYLRYWEQNKVVSPFS